MKTEPYFVVIVMITVELTCLKIIYVRWD